MNVYETTKFTQQKSRSLALAPLRAAINARLAAFRELGAFNDHGGRSIVSNAAKDDIRGAAGNPFTVNTHVWEVGISGHWRIFYGQGQNSLVVLCVGHLDGNTLEQP